MPSKKQATPESFYEVGEKMLWFYGRLRVLHDFVKPR